MVVFTVLDSLVVSEIQALVSKPSKLHWKKLLNSRLLAQEDEKQTLKLPIFMFWGNQLKKRNRFSELRTKIAFKKAYFVFLFENSLFILIKLSQDSWCWRVFKETENLLARFFVFFPSSASSHSSTCCKYLFALRKVAEAEEFLGVFRKPK